MKKIFEKYVNKKIAIFLVIMFFAWLNFSQAQNDGLNFFEDQDRDGLSDQEEQALGTDPANPDTDGDGYSDGVEVSSGYDPLVPAPGDRISDEATEVDNAASTVNLTEILLENIQQEKEGELKMLQAASATEEGLIETGETGDASLTEDDMEGFVNKTLQEGGVLEDELELIPEEEFNILPASQGDDEQGILDQEKKQVEEYFIEVGYILTENYDYLSGDQSALSSDLISLIMEVGLDLDEGDDSLVSEMKEDGGDVFGKLKEMEVPYVLKDVHITGVSLLGFMLVQNESIVFDQDDPAAMSLMLGKLQGAVMEMDELGGQLEGALEKYDIDTLDFGEYQDQVDSMYQ